MIDIHSHILPNIDDGARELSESINIIKKAVSNGVTDIVVTPHFILGSSYSSKKSQNKKLLATLKKELKDVPVNLYLGNEVFVDNDMVNMLKKGIISTINDSRYVLFELPMNNEFNGIKNLIIDLKLNGYVPVIAHPERYRFIKKDPTKILELIEAGALFQSNIGSVMGRYGKEAKKTLLLLLRHHAITFMGSDTHYSTDSFYDNKKECQKILSKIIDSEYITALFEGNARKALNDEFIDIETVIPFKTSVFHKYK